MVLVCNPVAGGLPGSPRGDSALFLLQPDEWMSPLMEPDAIVDIGACLRFDSVGLKDTSKKRPPLSPAAHPPPFHPPADPRGWVHPAGWGSPGDTRDTSFNFRVCEGESLSTWSRSVAEQ